MAAVRRSLGELERAVMEVLWDQRATPDAAAAGLSVREVHDRLSSERSAAYTTVMTVLDRMAVKGLVLQERSGRAFRYLARAGRAEMTAELMRGTLEDLAAEDRGGALVAFVDEASAEEVAALRRALASLEAD